MTINAKGPQVHRRKSSKEEDIDNVVVFPADREVSPPVSSSIPGQSSVNGTNGVNGHYNEPPNTFGSVRLAGPPRHARNISTPTVMTTPPTHTVVTSASHQGLPPSAGPYRTTFSVPRPPPNGLRAHPPQAIRQSLSLPGQSHSRTRSTSGPYHPLSPSPLASSFPISRMPHSPTAPELNSFPSDPASPPPSSSHTRRHSRLHSRNLSVFFPRPGSLPHTAIAEDGTQELVFPSSSPPSDGVPMPAASPGGSNGFRSGFTFGSRPPGPSPQDERLPPSAGGASRRGHHHKHSLSHNFFSFLEPGAEVETSFTPEDLHTTPAPVLTSSWSQSGPISPASETSESVANAAMVMPEPVPMEALVFPVAAALAQFFMGAWLWVAAQRIGSLACTGLGYWVVFDAFGVALGSVLPGWLARPSMKRDTRRSFG